MSRSGATGSVSPPTSRWRGFAHRGLLFALPVLLAVPVIAWFGLPDFSLSSEEDGPMMHVAQRREFRHDVTERGNVESASNVEIRCEVESHGAGTMILWIIPEGTYVTPVPDWEPKEPDEDPPDLLVKLDSSSLEDQLIQQQIVCNSSAASVIQAKNNYETAGIALDEYKEGRFEQEKLRIESAIFVAEEELRKAKDTLDFDREQLAMGYVTELQVQADEFAVEKRKKDLEEAKLDLKVLKDYTYDKTIKDLESSIAIAEANLESEQSSHELDLEKLAEVQEQVENCRIRAPEVGQVVYANVTNHRGGQETIIEEGTTVREHQVIIRLPDPKRMQVKANINEARVAMVTAGMPARIRLDAFPDLELEGSVEKVNDYPLPSGWWTGNVKEYETTVRIDELPKDVQLRPGMTAEVKIRVEQLSDVMQVPVQAVFEHGGKNYCVLRKGEEWEAREVVLGSTNDKVVVIRKGVKLGEEVVLGAGLYREKLDLPELKPEDEGKMASAEAMDRMDRPGDGAGGTPQTQPGPGQQAAGGQPPSGMPNPAQIFQKLDQNGDGRLEKDEIPAQMRSGLAALDANSDGAVDLAEFTAVMKKLTGPGAPGGPAAGPGERGPGPKAAPKATGGEPGGAKPGRPRDPGAAGRPKAPRGGQGDRP